MINKRKGLFETNSSSTHSLVVPKLNPDPEDYDLWTNWEEYNFCFARETYRILENWDDKLAYIYLVLLSSKNYTRPIIYPKDIDLQKFKDRIGKIYSDLNQHKPNDPTPEQLFAALDFKDNQTFNSNIKFDHNSIELTDKLKDFVNSDHSYSGVDHDSQFFIFSDDDIRESRPCAEFLNKLLTSDEYLKKFIFYDSSYITIGGDEYRGFNLKTVGFEYDYDNEEDWEKRVEEYTKDYEVYFKDN